MEQRGLMEQLLLGDKVLLHCQTQEHYSTHFQSSTGKQLPGIQLLLTPYRFELELDPRQQSNITDTVP